LSFRSSWKCMQAGPLRAKEQDQIPHANRKELHGFASALLEANGLKVCEKEKRIKETAAARRLPQQQPPACDLLSTVQRAPRASWPVPAWRQPERFARPWRIRAASFS